MSAELTLSDVCDLFAVSADTVRRWEKEGRIPVARRTSGNQRRWSALELARLAPNHSRPALWPSYDFVNSQALDRWQRAAWTAKCHAPGCDCLASNATLYVSGGDMGPRAFFWCHDHRGGLGPNGNISGADDGKVLPVQTLLGAVRAAIRQTRNKALIKHLVGEMLAAKAVENG
jgi:hypothetical protein